MRSVLTELLFLVLVWGVCALCLGAVVWVCRALHQPVWVQGAASAVLILRWMTNPAFRRFLATSDTRSASVRGSHD